MNYDERKSGGFDTRILQAGRGQAQQSASPARDEGAEMAELQRALLLYGTAGQPAQKAAGSRSGKLN